MKPSQFQLKELKEKLATYQKLEKTWATEKQAFLKNMELLEDQLQKQKALNSKLINKKYAHKRTCSDQQMFIFNQTNISSYYNHPVVMMKNGHQSQNWVTKANLRSHLDGVKSLCWLDNILISGGIDGLLKIWERDKLKITVRQHLAPIYTICKGSDQVFTGGAEGVIRMWNIKEFIKDQRPTLEQQFHEDSIWQLIFDKVNNFLVSSSSDDSLKVFKLQEHLHEIHTINIQPYTPGPICFESAQKIICGVTKSPKIFIFDLQSTKKPKELLFSSTQNYYQPNKLLYHSFTNQIISGHEDKYLRFFDSKSSSHNSMIKSIVAHSDSVTGISLNHKSPYEIFTCSHDGTVRIWDLRQYRCLADANVYMKKYDEGALCVEYADSYWQNGCAAVGGADGQIKLLNDH